ncbi:hypothetical protein OG413_02895 [Streptomyces sp. NBC_01433]|uniref:hypothetical protein n=1 Tax=Streptomyces sp. NBC_01433 TaxID=2903864 RepID=UPI0022528D8A|nr:hypothetical protein [Streptomyces sp. NBC_01433]MCX4674274.1 hypothetical protein [Streptomyces sp. NBC_01433]
MPPERAGALEMLDALDGLDLFSVFRRVACPLPLVRALHRVPPTPGLKWLDEMMDACAQGLARDLVELTAERREVTAEGVAATHAMLLEQPEQVAGPVPEFAASVAGGDGGS